MHENSEYFYDKDPLKDTVSCISGVPNNTICLSQI